MKAVDNKKINKRVNCLRSGIMAVFVLVILGLTHDIIITNYLAFKICKTDPSPKTYISKKVEFPESIYWEDNIYPGFDERDRILMIRNYLDGVHLKTMALNGPNGKIFVYSATAEDWQKSRKIEVDERPEEYFAALEAETQNITKREKIFTSRNMPRFNYSVVFNPIALTPFQERYLYSDEVKIVDNLTDEVIAYNRRLMRKWYILLPDIALGNRYYYPEAMCGGSYIYGFDKGIFSSIKPKIGSFHGMDINFYLDFKSINSGGQR